MSVTMLPDHGARGPRRGPFRAVAGVLVVVVVVVAVVVWRLRSGGDGAAVATPAVPALVPSGPPSLTSATSPDVLYRRMMAAVSAAGSVHVTGHGTSLGADLSFVQDAGKDQGSQHFDRGGGRSGDVRVVGATTWIRGDAATLRDFFGLPAATATADATHWLSTTSGDLYGNASASVTFESLVSEELSQTGLIGGDAVVSGPADHTGVSTYAITSDVTAAGSTTKVTLWLDAASGLPLEIDGSGGPGSGQEVFSRWGVPVRIVHPSPSRPLGPVQPRFPSASATPST